MKIVEACGPSREVGRQTGEQIRDEVRQNFEQFDVAKLLEQFNNETQAMLGALERQLPRVLDEMHGTAEGANVPFEHLAALHTPRFKAALDATGNTAASEPLAPTDACTHVVVGSGPDGPIWGKNNDGKFDDGRRAIICRVVKRDDAIPAAIITFAGMISCTDGINAEGFCVGHSSVGSVFQRSAHHVPIRLWAYEGMLQSRTTLDFVKHMSSTPTHGKGFAHVCVDRDGNSCSLESPCPMSQVRWSTHPHGHVHCVNCYQLPALADADNRRPMDKCNALDRWRYLDKRLDEEGPFDVARMKSILRSQDHPDICRTGREEDGVHTNTSAIGVAREAKLHVLLGYPNEKEYETVQL